MLSRADPEFEQIQNDEDEGNGWLVFERQNGVVEIVPNNDKYPHTGTTCVCEPTYSSPDGIRLIIIHNAFDFREIVEELNGTSEEKPEDDNG